MPMSEEEERVWTYQVRPLLWKIEDGCRQAKDAAVQLPYRPAFVSKAEAALSEAIRTLREAERTYHNKPVE